MKLLLDTHFLLWLMLRPVQISRLEQAEIESAESLHASVVSLWQIRIKWNSLDRHGHRKGEASPEDAMMFIDKSGMRLCPLTGADCIEPLHPSLDHKDPFDEMLLVHAQRLGARLLTRDRQMANHPVALIV